jgi:DNA-binding XRE family transcriptional regulator
LSRPADLARRLAHADDLTRAIARAEGVLDHLLTMRRVDPELPDNFFRTDSIVPPPHGTQGAPRPIDPIALAKGIGARIRATRERRGWTQQDLADRTGIRRPNIARLERGASLPNLATLNKIASGLEATLAELVTPA